MTSIQSIHPQWFGSHPWILPVSLLVLFVGLLLWITQIGWVQTLLGLRYPQQRQSDAVFPLENSAAVQKLEGLVSKEQESVKQLKAELDKAKADLYESAKSNLGYRDERNQCREEKRELQEKLSLLSPLQWEALMLARDLRGLNASLGPYPDDPLDPGESDPTKAAEAMAARSLKFFKWNRRLLNEYAGSDLPKRTKSLMRELAEQYDDFLLWAPDYADNLGSPITENTLPKRAQQMEMIVVSLNRRERDEVHLLGCKHEASVP